MRSNRIIKVSAQQLLMSDGVGVDIDLHPSVSAGKKMVGVAYRSHKALIDPVRFTEVIADDEIALAMATGSGAVLGTLPDPDPALVKSLMDRKKAGGAGSDAQTLYAVLPGDGVVWVSRRRLSLLGELKLACA